MPQMMPMYWLWLLLLCFLLIMLTITFIYFNPPEILIHKPTQIKSNLKKINWNWMWS